MPNIATALRAEISRLARKELRSETEVLRRAVAAYRHQLAEMKRRIEHLERQQKRAAKTLAAKQTDEESSDVTLRFRPMGFAAHRQRLGLSAREMGLLLNASPLSVYKWESGQSRPRAKHLEAIASVRKMGKREAAEKLEQLASA